jgi:predicted nucleic acid binding AN1-type Zn finger protein
MYRCTCCKKKIGLLNFKCNYCKNDYCVYHRTPEDHKCEKDYKTVSKEKNAEKLINNYIPESHNYTVI